IFGQVLGTSTSTAQCLRVPNTPPRLQWIFPEYYPPLFFLTFNTHRRRKLLATERLHNAFLEFAHDGAKRGMCVGRYVIMPDHIHLFFRGNYESTVAQWVRLLKRHLSKSIPEARPHWQDGFFDHLIRHSESYGQKWDYVRENPARAGLIANVNDWKWQGEIVRLEA
ncbi:MAG: hypothetical protein JWO45_1133, partial [Spartobacteria bacterium]|nr:hypothetical protein [Spartobacteria bacterium]